MGKAKTKPTKRRASSTPMVRLADWLAWSGAKDAVVRRQEESWGFPVNHDDPRCAKIVLPELARWLKEFLAENAAKLRQSEDHPDLRLKEIKADREGLKLRRERGELIESAKARAEIVNLARWVVGLLEKAGGELAGILAGRTAEEVKEMVNDYFDRAREEASEKLARP